MEMIALILCFLIVLVSTFLSYAWYEIRQTQKEVQKIIDICRDAVIALNSGR
jgi:hypothetical protein